MHDLRSLQRTRLQEEVLLYTVMCLIKVDVVDLNICIHDTMERIVGGKDDAVLAHVTSTVCIHVDFVTFGSAGVVNFTTVNMQHMQIWVTVVRINDSRNSLHSCSASKIRGATTTVVTPLLQRSMEDLASMIIVKVLPPPVGTIT